ncbi:MAG: metallophosphoesterase, partial [Clostridium sp.]|nr:metallophosphoesterase [Clostridium sp.]
DNNIDNLRKKYPNGLHFVVGDLHGSVASLNSLLDKIKYQKGYDYIYFVGDYCGTSDGNVLQLLARLSEDFQSDYSKPGFHLIRGNHDGEIFEKLPNVIAIKMKKHNFYISHAAVYNKVIDIIDDDMKKSQQTIGVYKFDYDKIKKESRGEAKKCYRMLWSITGNFNPQTVDYDNDDAVFIQDTKNSEDSNACIIHGHTPYFYFNKEEEHKKYGDKSVFWKKQCIWFSEDMKSFDIDSNIKGDDKGEERMLSCICLEVYDELEKLTIKNIYQGENGVFSVKHKKDDEKKENESNKITDLRKKINDLEYKLLSVENNELIIQEKNDDINRG